MNNQSEKFIENLSNKMAFPSKAESRTQAEKFIKWCLIGRQNNYCSLKITLQTLKNQAETNISKYNSCNSENDIKEKTVALCGISKHNISSETFFSDTAYKFSDLMYKTTSDIVNDNSNEVIVNTVDKFNSNIHKNPFLNNTNLNDNMTNMEKSDINDKFHFKIVQNESYRYTNSLTVMEQEKKKTIKSWSCNESVCKIYDTELLKHYEQFLLSFKTIKLNNIDSFLTIVEKCKVENADSSKLGHPLSCYINFRSCNSKFISTLILSPHFPNVRYIKNLVNIIIRLIKKIGETDKPLDEANLDYLQKEFNEVKDNCKSSEHEQTKEIELNEDCIKENFVNAFGILRKRIKDIPIHLCVSCEKLCYRRNVTEVKKMRAPLDTRP